MTGKMFCASHHTHILHSFHVLYTKKGHFIFVFSKATVVNYRIIRIVIYIYIRGKIHMYAQALTLLPYSFSKLINQCGIGHGAYHELTWKVDDAIEPHAQA